MSFISQIFLFADETKVLNSIRTNQDAVNLQNDIKILEK